MNKLMFVAAGVAVAGSAFAAPQVFDYKASVKHMYLKEVKLSGVTFASGKTSGVVYQKYQKSASLKGYLIMDQDGVTSATVTGGACCGDGATSFDYGRNRGFLVVLNSSAESKVRQPKILPAVLDAKWIDTAWKKNHAATSGLAEGTLFVGGDSIPCVRTQIDDIADTLTDRGTAPVVPTAGVPGMTAYADYVWTSLYLFGQFNGPNWFSKDDGTGTLVSPFNQFEYAASANWNDTIPTGLKQELTNKPNANYFHDTWMNGAGIGKYAVPSQTTGELCCGLTTTTTSDIVLDSLSGNLKGGLFLCTENGIDANSAGYLWWDGLDWEDQFNTARLDAAYAVTFAGDNWQNDLWQDGAVEQETTDVIYGTWSIKWNKKFFDAKSGIARTTPDDYTRLLAIQSLYTVSSVLDSAIYGAAYKLCKNVNFFDGGEIYDTPAASRFVIPMLTPQFVKYYGLAR